MTLSQTYLRQTEALQAQADKLQCEIDQLTYTMRDLQMDIQCHNALYRQHYREELESRRTFVPPMPRLSQSHAHLRAEWQVWRNHLDRVTAHPLYRYESSQTHPKTHRMLMHLSRFATVMMGIVNSQAWNPRNPNPHLP